MKVVKDPAEFKAKYPLYEAVNRCSRSKWTCWSSCFQDKEVCKQSLNDCDTALSIYSMFVGSVILIVFFLLGGAGDSELGENKKQFEVWITKERVDLGSNKMKTGGVDF